MNASSSSKAPAAILLIDNGFKTRHELESHGEHFISVRNYTLAVAPERLNLYYDNPFTLRPRVQLVRDARQRAVGG